MVSEYVLSKHMVSKYSLLGCSFNKQGIPIFSSCKPNEEWSHAALHCYNENEIKLSYMK